MTEPQAPTTREVWTIGHSNTDTGHLIGLLEGESIDAVADVRSRPTSSYTPHFNRAPLRNALGDAGIGYVFLGAELGGRPDDLDLYDPEGHVLYGRVAETDRFRSGIDRIKTGAATQRIALLCSEEDPTRCHRYLLVARVLESDGITTHHIRGSGLVQDSDAIETHTQWTQQVAEQDSLFDDSVRSSWRSTRPVSPKPAPKTSSPD